MEGENLDDPKKYTNLIAELVSLWAKKKKINFK
jgi:hypothetical protein